MKKEICEISDRLMEIDIMINRAYMLSVDLSAGSFSEVIETPTEAWIMELSYRKREMAKLETVINMLYDATKSLSYLQSALCEDDIEIDKNYELAEVIDKYGCDMEVASLMVQGKRKAKGYE